VLDLSLVNPDLCIAGPGQHRLDLFVSACPVSDSIADRLEFLGVHETQPATAPET